jgi:outer membrane protein OmpA-like peptidoglycan-associated protein
MPKRQQHGGGEGGGGGHGVGLWYISFSDMITLLLSFFVMLATFSSYSKESLDKFAGACRYISCYSVFSNRYPNRDAAVEPPNRPTDFTEEGSERPDGLITDAMTSNPREQAWSPEGGAYRDRKVFMLPSARLFLGDSSILSPDGIASLRRIGRFMKQVPCQAIISETSATGSGGSGNLARAVTVARCFVDNGVAAHRFGVSAAPAVDNTHDEPMIEITLLSGSAQP